MQETLASPRIEVNFQTIDDLLDEVQAGRVRIPRFQRAYRWKPSDMLALFDSIRRGYPIGGLLLWRPDAVAESSDRVGPMPIPAASTSSKYVVDGHQRVATLFGVLRLKGEVDESERWIWHIFYDLRSKTFVHKRRGSPEPWLLPLRLLHRSLGFVEFVNKLNGLRPSVPDVDVLLDEADALSQRFKGYKLLLMTLENGKIEDAIESFSRMNAKGQDIDAYEVFSALTYREGQFHLDRRIERINLQFSERGFGAIAPNTVLRSLLAISGARDLYRTDWAALATELGGRIEVLADETEVAMLAAIDFLRDCGVATARLLPYVHQLVFLAVYFHADSSPGVAERAVLERWFWRTSFAGSFAGISASETAYWVRAMRGEESNALGEGVYEAEPYPKQLRLASARVRVHLLALARMRHPRGPDGEVQKLDQLKALEARGGLPYIFEDLGDEERGAPANRLLWPRTRDLRMDLLNASESVLASHAIEPAALEALRASDGERFVRLRSETLKAIERQVMGEFGVVERETVPSDPIADAEATE